MLYPREPQYCRHAPLVLGQPRDCPLGPPGEPRGPASPGSGVGELDAVAISSAEPDAGADDPDADADADTKADAGNDPGAGRPRAHGGLPAAEATYGGSDPD
eukprot:292470-Pyramimonas_sp.AAC.1